MAQFVIAEFHAADGRLNDLLGFLKEVLPDTRAYDGFIRMESWLDSDNSTVILHDWWESVGHMERYLAWRGETGVLDALAGYLEGGMAGCIIRKCEAAGV